MFGVMVPLHDYWLGRWRSGDTGWHQDEVEPHLIEHFSGLAPTRVLVPLCGKSRDLRWLAEQGHEVLGVELSTQACEAFFAENGLTPETRAEARYVVREAPVGRGRIRLLQGDFFELDERHLNGPGLEFGALYDRAALIALPPELRLRYAARLGQLIHACGAPRGFRFLQIALEREPEDAEGPPYSVSADELEALYGSEFSIALRSRDPVEAKAPPGSVSYECVYVLSRKGAS